MPRKHIVRQGESLSEVSLSNGFADWKQLYDHPDNAELRQQRPDPNVLFPGDEIAIPELRTKDVSVATGATRRFKVKSKPRVLRLKLLDEEGQPLGDLGYVLTPEGQPALEGTTQGDGSLEAVVPMRCRRAELTVGERTFQLELGHLNPLQESPDEGLSGARARLENLGYAVPTAKDAVDAAMRVAIATFQADHGLEVDGELSATTLDTLREVHGC